MKSYGQQCALARALDVIGDRWTLLIVRELMVRELCRFTDLQNGLPGIASNLLARRLKEMEASGLLLRENAPPPIATTVYRLSDRGRGLEPVIAVIGRWGEPLLRDGAPNRVFRDHWIALPLRLYLRDKSPQLSPISIELRIGKEILTLKTEGAGRLSVLARACPDCAVRIGGDPREVLALLAGKLSRSEAKARRLTLSGNVDVIDRLAWNSLP
jgi:DNA-binding HxlR family transcriptional regulator